MENNYLPTYCTTFTSDPVFPERALPESEKTRCVWWSHMRACERARACAYALVVIGVDQLDQLDQLTDIYVITAHSRTPRPIQLIRVIQNA